MDDRPSYLEDLQSCAFHLDRRTQDDFLQLSSMQNQLHSAEVQFFRPTDPVHVRVTEDSEIEKRHFMQSQGEKEDDLHGFIYGWRHGLSLTLGSHLLSNTVAPYNYDQMKEHVSCTNHEIMREDLKELNCSRHRPPRVEYMFSEGESSAICTANTLENTSQDVAPLTSALRNSRYLKPAQELLDEVVSVRNAVELSSDEELRKVRSIGMSSRIGSRSLQIEEAAMNCEGNVQLENYYSSEDKNDADIKVGKLVALLDELESRYQQYVQRMDRVISSFELVAGSGVASSYTALTIQAMSRHFSNLRDAIIAQIHASRDPHQEDMRRIHRNPSKYLSPDESMRQKREALQKLGIIQNQQVWRPLRGLPEDSVAVLRTWLFENFLHPYPDDNEKLMLASKTGLTRNQISNWFINARVRIWKPMIEEMYREEFAEDSGNLSTSS
ncbi:BEL1-like homeodomain protein 11 isoform X2 [Canna indica]|uniref:BEL1-like homeodomain protein 11 isoform X2 n=1 Tax=Canna indica TaxID=4628 RepID=A0AAQ3JZR0_9LILI|nr:BEL1-like homeodomain protein 11 isoform X2 [Canna indica]